jgi:hypothetical protein
MGSLTRRIAKEQYTALSGTQNQASGPAGGLRLNLLSAVGTHGAIEELDIPGRFRTGGLRRGEW